MSRLLLAVIRTGPWPWLVLAALGALGVIAVAMSATTLNHRREDQ